MRVASRIGIEPVTRVAATTSRRMTMCSFRFVCFGFLASFVACAGTSEDSPSSGGAAGEAGAATGGAAGASGGAAGSAGSSAGSAGSTPDGGIEGGTGGTGQCDAILAQHEAALQKAKECSLLGGPSTCSVQVYLPPCGHWDFMDSSNKAEIDELEALSKKFNSLNCPKGVCATGGYGPTMSTCKQPGGQGADSGRCQ